MLVILQAPYSRVKVEDLAGDFVSMSGYGVGGRLPKTPLEGAYAQTHLLPSDIWE